MRQRSTNYKMMATERNKTITLSGINSLRRGLDSGIGMQRHGDGKNRGNLKNDEAFPP